MIKDFFKEELSTFKGSINKWEYMSWWLIRIIMAVVLAHMCITDPTNSYILMVSLNIVATFTVPLARIILFPKKLMKKLPFRCQTWLNIMIFIGSCCGQGMGLNHMISNYDKFLHVLAGALIVFMGNELLVMFMRKEDRLSPEIRTFSATGFSFMAIVAWEIFEFFADYYMVGSTNQGYASMPDTDMLFFKIFGLGVQNEGQWAVIDTNVDMLYAVVGAVPGAVALVIYLYIKEKKAKAELPEEAASVTE